MLDSIVKRSRHISPLNESEKKIIRSAAKLFLGNGFSQTTLKMISADCGMRQGTIAYHFHTKEDMLYMLIQELMASHTRLINKCLEKTDNPLVAYALEIAIQIAVCDTNDKARDLYYSAYIHESTFEVIKTWTAEKTKRLLGDRLPGWTDEDYDRIQPVVSCIEMTQFKIPATDGFTTKDKIALIAGSMMKYYDIEESERKEVIDIVINADFSYVANEMFKIFKDRVEND